MDAWQVGVMDWTFWTVVVVVGDLLYVGLRHSWRGGVYSLFWIT